MNKDINIWSQKLNIAIAIYEIGIKRTITLWFDDYGNFVVKSKKDEFSPEGQQEYVKKVYLAKIRIESEEGDWAKYAAEKLLWIIDKQIEMAKNGEKWGQVLPFVKKAGEKNEV